MRICGGRRKKGGSALFCLFLFLLLRGVVERCGGTTRAGTVLYRCVRYSKEEQGGYKCHGI